LSLPTAERVKTALAQELRCPPVRVVERWRSVVSRSPVGRVCLPLALAAIAGAIALSGTSPELLAASAWVGVWGLCEALLHCESRRLALACGLAFGTAANVASLFSLAPLLGAYAHLPAPLAWCVAALAWLAQGVPYAVAAHLARAIARRGWPRWSALGVGVTCALALCPQLFPWHLAASQIGFLWFAQVAELGGESLLGLCFVAAASALHGCLRARGKALYGNLAVAMLALVGPASYGVLRIPAIEAARERAPKLQLGVVQANAPLPDPPSEAYARESLANLQALTVPLERAGAELTLWGESAYPYPLLRSATEAPDDVRAPLAAGVHGPVLLGLETYGSFLDGAARYNSAWLVHRDGRLGHRVDKARLIPFGEYVPFWRVLPPLQRYFHAPGFSAGVPGTVRSHGSKLGVLICYEDLFAASARATVRDGARVLVNLTNDVWFGPGRVPFLHDLVARLRAVEQRRDLVRAVNTGRSSFTSATGAQLWHSEPFTRASFLAEVALLDARTPYSLLGDLTAPACALLALLALTRPRPLRTSRAA
jgi:apolipoprotein N-acyltransferase